MLVLLVASLLLGVGLAVPVAPNATAREAVRFTEADYRLPTDVLPLAYDVQIIPYFENAPNENLKFKFEGEVRIRFRARQAVQMVRLHAHDMTINPRLVSVRLLGAPSESPNLVTRIERSADDKQFLDVFVASPFATDVRSIYLLTIKYVGNLNDALEGFYRSSYVNYRGETVWLGVTQFEPTGARRAFPCFDEPSMKALFTLHIAREPLRDVTANTRVSAANRPVLGDHPEFHANWVWVDFEQSVIMPTYLVAFAVHDFGYVTATSADGAVDFKVLARREFVDSSTDYANKLTPDVLKYFETYTNVKYPASMKVDQIALPDFAAGAMENWGLITYREVNLLHDKFFSTTANKQRIATVVTHELAHQWFGNLVSPEWWREIWLNEGFATYFEFFAADKVERLMGLEEAFIKDEMQATFLTDSLDNTHPLTTPVDTPASANAAFDNIAYGKGACIVRFLITLLGADNFQTGIRNYITENAYGTGTKDKLWENLNAVVTSGTLPPGTTLSTVMDTWADQPGYPLITVTRNYNTKAMTFQQERFHSTKRPIPSLQRWYVPLTLVKETQTGAWQDFTTRGWLIPGAADLTVTDIAPERTEWIILNPRQTGYYRVNYDAENWKLIIATLNNKAKLLTIGEINRAQIIDDSMALAKGKYLTYETALATTEYLSHEDSYLPWDTALRAFHFIGDRLTGDTSSKAQFFRAYLLAKMSPMYSELNGFAVSPEDGHVKRLHRNLMMRWACNFGHSDCRSEAKRLFLEWKQRPSPDFQNPIDPDLRSVVYCHGMENKADFEFLFTRYTNAHMMPSEMDTLLSSLGCAPTEELLMRVLNETVKITDQKIRFQDTRTAFISVINNPMGVDIALDFLVEQFDDIKLTYQAFGSVTRLFAAIAGKLNTEAQRKKLEDFLAANDDEPENIKSSVRAAIAVVNENMRWLTDNKVTVLDFFEKKMKSGATKFTLSPLIVLIVAVVNHFWF